MSHTIPIEVPPGRKGMDPGLELIYRSGSGDGWVGVGWELEAGAIERGTKWGVCYSCDDYLFRMAGATIDLVNIGNGEYRAKIEGAFSRIRRFTATDGKPYWEVTDRSGTRYFFGRSAASRQDNPAAASEIFKWLLDRVEDTDGNYMTFSYFKNQNQVYLDRIDYAGNGTIAPNIYVKFYRESRTDAPAIYTTNFEVRTAYRLKTIDVVANNARVRTYKLSYRPGGSPSTLRSLLESVQQFGKNAAVDANGTITNEATASKLPASTFTYSSDGSFASFTDGNVWRSGWCSSGGAQFGTGDFNGDGNLDIWCHDRALGSSMVQQTWTTTSPNWGGSGFTWTGDFNGDGLTDIATANGGTIWVKRSTGSGFVQETWTTSAPNWGGSGFTWTGDFNGDGLTDIATAYGGTIWVKRSTGSGFVQETWTTSAPNWGGSGFTWTGDFNGDGLTDIATADGGTIWVKRSTGSGFVQEIWTTSAPNWSGDTNVWTGDFNGDGLTDIAARNNGVIWVKRSTGSSFVEENWGAEGSWGTAGFRWATDFNGDGLTDIATASGGTIWVKRSTGSSFVQETWTTSAPNWGGSGFTRTGDFNGDGLTDIATASGGTIWVKQSLTGSGGGNTWVALSNGAGAFTDGSIWLSGWCNHAGAMFGVGDFDGNGKTDLFCHDRIPTLGGNTWIALSNGVNGFWDGSVWRAGWCNAAGNMFGTGDFNGDGKTDLFCKSPQNNTPGTTSVAISNGAGSFTDGGVWFSNWCGNSGTTFGTGDFNGDGRTDIFCHDSLSTSPGSTWIGLSNGQNAFIDGSLWRGGWCGGGGILFGTGDFNGDGKADIFCHEKLPTSGGITWVALSNGAGAFWDGSLWRSGWCTGVRSIFGTGDFNGDGKTDIFCKTPNNNTPGTTWVAVSSGSAFINGNVWLSNWCGHSGAIFGTGDFSGDGRTDVFCHDTLASSAGNTWIARAGSTSMLTDLVVTISNGIGGTSTIGYTPSSRFETKQLPFPVYVVSSVTTNSGNISSTTDYAYSEGYYYFPERDFRGFNRVTVTGPLGPNGERSITYTSFHQGNDVGYGQNDPNVSVGYMKGKPYRVVVTNGSGQIFSEVRTNYGSDNVEPYFNPPTLIDTFLCDGDGCGVSIRVIYVHDSLGNLTREEHQVSGAIDRIVTREFSPNTGEPWIISLPYREMVSTAAGAVKSSTDFYYDGVSSGTTGCQQTSSNTLPQKGNLTRIVRWLEGGTSPETRMAYDSYGNLVCTRNANGNTTAISYDGSFSFPKVTTNPLGHQTTTQYYGIDGVAMDTGLYGQVKSVTDNANNVTTTTTYDPLGRRAGLTPPSPDAPTTWSYNSFGAVGQQHVQSTTAGLSTWTYFDGLGRTTLEKRSGPDGKTIATQSVYNNTGTVKQTALPYFDGLETPIWRTFIYDPIGRMTQVTNPDGTRILQCYNDGVTVAIDANNHRKREVRDAFGRLVQVNEYQSTFTTCTIDVGTPYATTTYQYDVLGSLVKVTDAKGNQTTMRYDTLGRKIAMSDPDMGRCGDLTALAPAASYPWYATPCWNYRYDAVGNLLQQRDAKGQTLHFQYDALNRLLQKDYTTLKSLGGGDVVYRYDNTTAGTNRMGRLWQVSDSSGIATFTYDKMGRQTRTDKSIISTSPVWTTETVDSVGNVGQFTSVGLDTNGNPHISYFDPANGRLKYAKWTGSSWAVQTVDTSTFSGYYTSLAIDSAGNPHISYYNSLGFDLKYAKWTGSSWAIQTVETAGDVGRYTSLALDSGGNPHISYYDYTNRDLKYAKWNGSSWTIQTVDSIGDVGAYTSLALDSAGNPRISYRDVTNGDLKYARWTGGNWVIQIVDSVGNVGEYGSLALDNGGNPYISYLDLTNSDLKYAKWTGSSWVIQTVDSAGITGYYTSLKLDNNANPHISYSASSSGVSNLKYAKWTGSSWMIQTVDSSGNVGSHTSLGFDTIGTPQISYYDSTNQDLKYAKFAPGTAVYTTQAGYDSLGRVSSVGYPDGASVQYAYNGPLLDKAYEGTTTYARYTGYNAVGQPAKLTLGNGVTTDYQYKPNNFRLHSIFTTHAATSQCFQSLLYNYDSVANVKDIIDYRNPTTGVCGSVSEANTQNFGYDGLNRLTAATGPYGAFSYVYDQIGNMTFNSQVGNYTYPASGPTSVRPHAVAQAGANTYQYDANGNMTSGAGRTITYDIEDRPILVVSGGVTTTFIYDGDGGRVKKTAGGITTVYIGKLYECTGSACSKYIFAGGQRIALKPVGSSEVYYYQSDHLGSSNIVTNQAGSKVEELTYYPYGQTRTNTGSINVNHKYTSQELDSSTGLYFYNARYYDPVLGRFIQADTIVPDPTDPQAFNRYSYVLNNPINYIDPSGHSTLGKIRDGYKRYRRDILGAAVVATTIVVAIAVPHPITIGAAIGSTAGYSRAYIVGGDPLKGAIYGAAIGAAIGAMFTPEYTMLADSGTITFENYAGGGAAKWTFAITPEGAAGATAFTAGGYFLAGLAGDGDDGSGGSGGGSRGGGGRTSGMSATPTSMAPCPQNMNPATCRGAYEGALRSFGLGVFTIPEVIAGSRLISASKTLIQYERQGGFAGANRIFDKLTEGLKVSVAPNGTRWADLPGGGRVNVRPTSTYGQPGAPTLEVTRPGLPDLKFRFPE
jgi:RHS repeat-associated protein